MKKDKAFLISINALMQMIFTFFNIFFSIYIYEMSENINFVLGYSLFQIVGMIFVQCVITNKMINKKTFNILYRSSFFLVLLAIGLIFTINTKTLYMAFVVQFVYSIALIFFYVPHEIATMNKNKRSQMKSFIGVNTIVALIASVSSPFISGYVIDYISYYFLFGFIMILAAVCVLLSFFIQNDYVDTPSMGAWKYFKKSMSIKRLRLSYFAYGFYKFSQDTVIGILLPLLLFLKVGTNFSVGMYSALASIVGGVGLMIYVRFVKRKDVAILVSTALMIAAAFILTFWTTIVAFFIYYFVRNLCTKIYSNGLYENIFSAVEGTELVLYKKQHHLIFSLFNNVFQIFAYLLAFLIYNCVQTVASLSFVILALTLALILSAWLLLWSDRLYANAEISNLDLDDSEAVE